jgi:hypothetical protein
MGGLGRALLIAGAVLLLGTATLHALGCDMVAGWLEELPHQQSRGLQLVWLTDSLSWAIVASAWLVTAYRPDQPWRRASVVLSAIPLLTGVGIVSIDPTFFGGYLLLASSLLGAVGAALSDNCAGPKSDNAEAA